MPRAIWKGAIGFGLVTIPVSLYPALRREELAFHMLRESDLSPISFKRVAKNDGKEVPWDKIVKGYEYEKGKYVVLKPEDFARVDIEATQTVDILSFVDLDEVDPVLFNKPYFMEAGKGGDKAYALLRDSLAKSNKIAIAKVVIKTRQYLAAVKPKRNGLVLELMYFPDELIDDKEFNMPGKKEVSAAEMKMATQLIDSMTVKWDPTQYDDDYQNALEKMIEEKIERGGEEPEEAPKPKRRSAEVIDLAEVLKQSLARAQGGANKTGPEAKRSTTKATKTAKKSAKKSAGKKAPARKRTKAA
ncbi:MAG: Ku protein [Proteobacteria bacterium]|nr:MAG: Ku protein [Pseudomonadota bacterium]